MAMMNALLAAVLFQTTLTKKRKMTVRMTGSCLGEYTQTQTHYTPGPITKRELDLYRTLQTHLTLGKTDTFTTDTLRQLGFDRFMQKDKRGHINYGTLIYKWKLNRLIEATGETVCSALDSNHSRRIMKWKVK